MCICLPVCEAFASTYMGRRVEKERNRRCDTDKREKARKTEAIQSAKK